MIRYFCFALLLFFCLNINASSLSNKSIICSTNKFTVKGGFVFTSDNTLDRYNILLNLDTGKQYIKKSSHCYTLINNEYAITEKSIDKGCGKPNSYIDSNSLEYMMLFDEYMLSANCSLFDGDLIEAINNSLIK